jgi:hypothetical protein
LITTSQKRGKMFNDTEGMDDFNPDSIKPAPSYGNAQGGAGGFTSNGGAGGFSSGGSFSKFQKKPEVVTDIPYAPVAFFLDRDHPQDVKDRYYSYINMLIAKNMTIRINGDDKDFIAKLKELNYDKLEVYIPWKNFNEIESKFYYNGETSKLIAAKYISVYDKLPDAVKALLARNARLLFGEKNNSCVLSLITWSPDAASRIMDISKNTGRASHIIKMALSNHISVLNVQRENADMMFKKSFRLES